MRIKISIRRALLPGILIFLMSPVPTVLAQDKPEKTDDHLRAEQIKDMKFGMFICWSFSTFSGTEWTPTLDKDASYFKATGCDTHQWYRVARDAGTNYILFLSKHHDGFCFWDTETTDKKVTNSSLGIGVLAQLRESCDKYGLKLALYFSEGDWNWPGAVDGKNWKAGESNNPEMKKAQLKEGPCGFIHFPCTITFANPQKIFTGITLERWNTVMSSRWTSDRTMKERSGRSMSGHFERLANTSGKLHP